MAKLGNDVVLTVVLVANQGFRIGTAKAKLIGMSQELGQFTKQAWIDRACEFYTEAGLESVMVANHDKVYWAKAWFAEFYTKAGVFQPLEDTPTES